AWLGPHPDPDWGARRPDMVAKAIAPDLLFHAHSAPLGLVFYEGAQFPASYKGDAFVALHGSWNSGAPTGYKVVRVPFTTGRRAATRTLSPVSGTAPASRAPPPASGAARLASRLPRMAAC